MIRVIQNLPNKFFKSLYGGVYRANRGQTIAEKYQDGVATIPSQSPVLDASFHTSRRYEALGSQDKHGNKEEWERSFKQRLEWDSFWRSSYTQEAVGWGSIIVLGLQLGRFFTAGSPSDNRRKSCDLLSSVAQSLPGCSATRHVSSKRSILPEKETLSSGCRDDTSSSSHETLLGVSDDNDAWDFEASTTQSSSRFQRKWQTLSTPSSVADTSTSLSSSSSSTHVPASSSAGGIPSPAQDFKPTFDRVTQQCWGRVNNIIGGYLMSEGEEEKAVDHFKLSSEAGYSKGQYNLGMCHEMGRGVLQDDEQAGVYFALAAKQGHHRAQYKLGAYHLEGKGNFGQCQKTAVALITQAAGGGVTQAQIFLGMYYMSSEKEDPKRAVMYLKEAAAKKDTEAEYHLGLCYEFGWGVETNTAKAASLYHSAANKDHAPSLFALGLFYEQGLGGLPENVFHARELFTKASSLGFDKATERLSEMDSENTESSLSDLDSNSSLYSGSNSSLDSLTSSDSFSVSGASSDFMNLSSHVEVRQRLMRASCSAPELTRKQEVSGDIFPSGDGDGAHVQSILHSLSCLSLIFPQLHDGWSVKSHAGQLDGGWTLSSSLGQGDQKLVVGVGRKEKAGWMTEEPSVKMEPCLGRVRFQLGGGVDEEEDDLDWCDPIDAIAQQRLVSFRRAAAVV